MSGRKVVGQSPSSVTQAPSAIAARSRSANPIAASPSPGGIVTGPESGAAH
jgi:hypothetical protein